VGLRILARFISIPSLRDNKMKKINNNTINYQPYNKDTINNDNMTGRECVWEMVWEVNSVGEGRKAACCA
jgi:hypothetical protein